MLDPKTRINGPSGTTQGRNWTRAKISRVLPGTLRTIEKRPGTAPKVVSTGPAPWPDTAYVVTADGEDGRVLLPDDRELGPEAVAAALAADPELAKLPKDVPVVLAVPYTGDRYQQTLQAVADRLGRTVWGPSGGVRAVADGPDDHVSRCWTTTPTPRSAPGSRPSPRPRSGPTSTARGRRWTGPCSATATSSPCR